MSEPTNQELKELILSLDKKIDLKTSELEKKMEVGFESVRGEIKRVEEKLEGGIKEVKGEIKRVEEKLEAKIDGLDKRLSNEEVVSRTAFIAVVGGVAAGLVKLFFFPGNP